MKKVYRGGTKILLLLLILLIIGVSTIIFGYSSSNKMEEIQSGIGQKAQDIVDESSEQVMEKVVDRGKEAVGEKLKETGEKMLSENNAEPGSYGVYGVDSADEFERTILFFTTLWCPSCMEVQDDIEKNSDAIPSNIVILYVDIDNNNELCEKHSVSKQHTFVFIDQNGTEISRWNNSKTLREIVDNIK